MPEPIEGEYFNWLCAKVLSPGGTQYYDLLRLMYQTEFTWIILGDRNRVEDGLELRRYFLNESRTKMNHAWYNEPCSVLEVLIAFAQRAYFQTDTPVKDWFWEFMTNLMIGDFRQLSRSDIPVIEEVLHAFIWRTYEPSGQGGIFPLQWPKRDQRQVELWYQFCDYVDERGLI